MKFIYFLLFTCFIFFSCHGDTECSGKQVTCPAFSDDIALQWIIYKTNDQIVFKSENNVDTFVVQQVQFSGTHDETVNGRNPNCVATADFYSVAKLNNKFNDGFHISITNNLDQFTSAKTSFITIDFKDAHFYGGGFTDTGLIIGDSNQFQSFFYSSLPLGNYVYADVQVVMRDTTDTSNSSIYKIWVCKHKGIIAYEDYLHHELWIKQ